MKALVTGATGLIGSCIVEHLLEQGYEVRALARKTSDLSHLKTTGAEIVFGDIEDYDSLPPVVQGVDVVFHSAGRVTVGWGSQQDFEVPIVKGTENILRATAQDGVKRFIYLSSGGIYGKICEGDVPVCESTQCRVDLTADTYYEYAKLQAENAVFDYHNQGKIRATILRLGGVYGPRDRLFADRVFRQVTMLPIIAWPGKSNPRLATIYVSDVAECALLASTSDKAVGQAYNVGPPYEIRLKEFANIMLNDGLGQTKFQFTIPYALSYAFCGLMEVWSKLRRAKGMPFLTRQTVRYVNKGLYLDTSKIKEELGWEPKISAQEGSKLYVKWRLSQAKK